MDDIKNRILKKRSVILRDNQNNKKIINELKGVMRENSLGEELLKELVVNKKSLTIKLLNKSASSNFFYIRQKISDRLAAFGIRDVFIK